jgi:hypothetical protein
VEKFEKVGGKLMGMKAFCWGIEEKVLVVLRFAFEHPSSKLSTVEDLQ